jgi:hypothetical protein
MRISQSIFDGSAWLFLLSVTAVAAISPSTVTVYAWPLDAVSPAPLASIVLSQSQSTLDLSATVKSFTPPSESKEGLVRIGLLDPNTKAWSGVATSSKSLAADLKKKISLHTDKNGNVYHIGFSASAKEVGEKDAVVVEVVPMSAGPEPLLNKPVILNAEGKVDTPNPEDNKSFLQK